MAVLIIAVLAVVLKLCIYRSQLCIELISQEEGSYQQGKCTQLADEVSCKLAFFILAMTKVPLTD